MSNTMDLLPANIEAFAVSHTSALDALLTEIETFTYAQHPQPHMLSGKVQGKLLQMISHMIRPQRVLEIGTFTGYSALCLADGLTPDGIIHTIESRAETAAIAQGYFDRSPLQSKIKLHVGDAQQIIPTLQEPWDLVFIDADKTGYETYFTMVLPAIKKNGFILADNIFFHGEALQPEPKGKSAKAIASFNELIQQRTDIDKLVLTIRDGLYLIRKL